VISDRALRVSKFMYSTEDPFVSIPEVLPAIEDPLYGRSPGISFPARDVLYAPLVLYKLEYLGLEILSTAYSTRLNAFRSLVIYTPFDEIHV